MKTKTQTKQLIDEAVDVSKGIKLLVKEHRELLSLVCYMRKMLDNCLTNDMEPIDYSEPKLLRAFEVMMREQHELDLIKEEKKKGKANKLHVEGQIEFNVAGEPTIDEFYGDDEV